MPCRTRAGTAPPDDLADPSKIDPNSEPKQRAALCFPPANNSWEERLETLLSPGGEDLTALERRVRELDEKATNGPSREEFRSAAGSLPKAWDDR